MSEASTIDYDDAARIAFDATSPANRGGLRIGLEVEYLPVVVDDDGCPAGRPNLPTLLHVLDGLGTPTTVAGNPALDLGRLGVVTFEPGGQIEHAGPPLPPGRALEVAAVVESAVAERLAAAGMASLSLGWDPWHDPETVGQQLPGDRYRAMDRYFRRRGDLGPQMMRNTCALQVNVDTTLDRWKTACVIAPLLTATFATAPDAHAGSRRASIWQRLDPTRTGVPSPDRGPADALFDLALMADVLLVRRPGGSIPGVPGWTFADWIDRDHPVYGRPDEADFAYHLTTLFPEVRPRRGWLELRGIDALPARSREAAVVLVTGGLYDGRAADEIREIMSPHLHDLSDLWRNAARAGLTHPTVGSLADAVWAAALDGARRSGLFDEAHLASAEEYLDRWVATRQAPGRWLAERTPEEVVAWAASTATVTA